MPYSLSLLIFTTLMVSTFVPTFTFAQLEVNNTSDEKNLQTLQLSKPILQKLSDSKVYMVTLKSGQASSLYGLNFEIVFLNASSTNLNIPPANAESNVTTDRQDTVGMTVPSVVEQVIPVKSFDIRIVGNNGNELFNKTGEVPQGGRIFENVDLKNYTGHITIDINNIILDPSWNEIVKKQLKQASDPSETIRDSVKFDSEVIKS
jgi:hypothetical protein